MDKHNSEWMTVGPWYNTSICKKLHGKVFEGFLEMQELTDIISCVLLTHMKKSIHHRVMMAAAVGFFHCHQIKQQNNLFFLVQPYISSVVG